MQKVVKFNKYRGIAQLVERRSPKPCVEGSSPSAPARKTDKSKLVGFSVIFALRRVILLRSYIWASPKLYSLREFYRRI